MLLRRFLVTNFLFDPENDNKNPASIACNKVDFTGNPRDAWWNYAKSFFVVSDNMTALHVLSMFCCGTLSSRLTIAKVWIASSNEDYIIVFVSND